LERIHELAHDYVNFLHPVRKLTENVRRGARITRRYDAAQTPYRRLLDSGVLPRKVERELAARSAAVNPVRLKLELESAQRTLAQHHAAALRAPGWIVEAAAVDGAHGADGTWRSGRDGFRQAGHAHQPGHRQTLGGLGLLLGAPDHFISWDL
jgi:hypothetical protein